MTILVLASNETLNIFKNDLDEKHGNWTGMTNLQVNSRVHCVRQRTVGNDVFRIIENTKVAKMKDTDRFYLQFNMELSDPESGKMHRITGFGNPTLIPMLKGKIQLHLDCAFQTTPRPCKQCLLRWCLTTQARFTLM